MEEGRGRKRRRRGRRRRRRRRRTTTTTTTREGVCLSIRAGLQCLLGVQGGGFRWACPLAPEDRRAPHPSGEANGPDCPGVGHYTHSPGSLGGRSHWIHAVLPPLAIPPVAAAEPPRAVF